MLKLENIKKYYGKVCALDDISLSINDGALYGFAGPNGAGKTTLLKIMSGIIPPDEGCLLLDGEKAECTASSFKRNIGYVPDTLGIYNNLKVYEYMEFYASCYGINGLEAAKRISELLSYVRLSDREDSFVDYLSRGMKQRLSVARALIHDPGILIMDEPAAGLDPRTRKEFKELLLRLSDQGKTIVLSSHILSDISEMCTDIVIMDKGSIALKGRLDKVMKQMSADNPIAIKVRSDVTAALKFLRNDASVTSVAVHGRELMFHIKGGEKEEERLLREMIEQGISVIVFSRRESTLESAFMKLTGDNESMTISSYEPEKNDVQSYE